MPVQEFKDRLIAAREALQLSQTELGKRADMLPTQVSRYESGRAVPRRAAVERLAKALQVNTKWLLDGSEPPDAAEMRFEDQPDGTTVVVLRSDTELAKKLEAAARRAGVDAPALMRMMLEAWAEQQETPHNTPKADALEELRLRVERIEGALGVAEITGPSPTVKASGAAGEMPKPAPKKPKP